MLSVRIDGQEVETTPVSLARLVFDGRADRRSPSKSPGTTAERSLEQSLESPHYEALSDELLHRVWAIYGPHPYAGPAASAVEVQGLCNQVERLCRWHWPSPHIASRFLWTAAWLNDLMDRLETAGEFYDAFLQASSREEHLRRLAYNNRGVLRIRLGRLEGVQDLARAAIADPVTKGSDNGRPGPESSPARPSAGGLPAAGFNLLNLINTAMETGHLVQVIDEELAEFFRQIPEDLRTLWLGPDVPKEDSELPPFPGRNEERDGSPAILRDPTYRRLNMLTARLASQARRMAGADVTGRPRSANARHPTESPLSATLSRLALWECRANGGDPTREGHRAAIKSSNEDSYAFCAEAASLLLRDDVPSSLARLESPLARAEQAVCEELASIDSWLAHEMRSSASAPAAHRDAEAPGYYDLARSRLHVQRKILLSLDGRGRLAGLLASVDARLKRIAHLESQHRQLDLQGTCAGLIASVERFCRFTDLYQAQREHGDLADRLRRVRSAMEPPNGQEVTVLLDELTDRLNRHLHRLKRLEIRRAIRSPLRHLRRNWPKDAASPVPESVYHAVAQCRLSDPERVVEDWVALEEQLDTHQGRYHMQRALLAWQSPGQASWEQVCEDLAKALVLKPDLWSAVAPRLGVPRPPDHVFDAAPGEAGGATDASNAEDAMQRAGRLLECTLEQMTGRTTRCLRLWEHVAATLSPVLERGDLDAMARVASLAERCLDRWPIPAADPLGRLDPRNPVSLFLESCEKARRLVQAGQRLDARPPQWRKAREGYAEALDLGLETHDALRRAVRGLYLAICHAEDAPHVQRQRLTQLETWVDEMSDEAIRRVRESHVVQEIERLREDRMDCGRRPPKKGM